MKVLGIYGSGGAGKESKEIADLLDQWSEIVFIDDYINGDLFKGIKRISFETFIEKYGCNEAEVIVSIGEPESKKFIFEKVKRKGYSFANLIHPSAYISPDAKMGSGLIVKANALISSDALVGDNVSLQENSIIGHDSVVSNHCQIAANSVIAGGCYIGLSTYIGLGVPIKEGVRIGNNTVVGMGSVVVRDLPDNVIALGNPARPIKYKDDSKVFK